MALQLSKGRPSLQAFMVVAVSLLAALMVMGLVTTTARADVKKAVLKTENRSSFNVMTCTNFEKDKDEQCDIKLSMGESFAVHSKPLTDTYWPTVGGKAWREDTGAACLDPPKAKAGGGYEECTRWKTWKDLGLVIKPTDNPPKDYQNSILFSRGKPKVWSKTKIYIVSMTSAGKYRISVTVELIPETASRYDAFILGVGKQPSGDYEYTVNVYRGEHVRLSCGIAAKRDPPSLDHFCPSASKVSAPCTDPQLWSKRGVIYTPDKINHLPVNNLAYSLDYEGKGAAAKNAFFQCTNTERDNRFLFHLKLYPTISDRLIPPSTSSFPNAYRECHQEDGPQPDKPCQGGGKVYRNMFAYINCTGLGNLDPPDFNNKDSGSFCTAPYKDVDTKCATKKKWADIFAEPQVQINEDVIAVFNGRDNLKTDEVTVYGRCSNVDGKVLFFQYTLSKSEAVKKNPGGAKTPSLPDVSAAAPTTTTSSRSSVLLVAGLGMVAAATMMGS